MKEFDLIVIGGGSGLNVSSAAADSGMKVAIVEEGPLGGTCLNRGCIPSKMIIHAADVAEMIDKAGVFGLRPKGYAVDFASVTRRASRTVDADAREIERNIRQDRNMELFKKRCRFVAERTLAVGNKKIRGRKVVVAAGARPTIPQIDGINDVPYITSTEALRLTKQPKSMIVLGGGFIAAELAHFYGSLGTKVTIVQRSVLLRNEDREVADLFTKIFGRKHDVVLGYETESVRKKGKQIVVTAKQKNGKRKRLEAEALLVATGVTPNTDILEAEKGKIETNERGFIKVNSCLETTAGSTWALGDIVGKYLLKHNANLEAKYVVRNALYGKREKVDYWPMPHAIFTSPQIAAVGHTEEELKEKNIDYAVGRYYYRDTGMGAALAEKEGFVKVLADRKTRQILGCHLIGPDASTAIHEVIVAMKHKLTANDIANAVHIHPALSEVVQRACARVEW